MAKVFNWGRYPSIEAEVVDLDRYDFISEYVLNTGKLIARGNGKCYGDSALQTNIFSTLKLNKFISLDTEKGVLRCQSGVMLNEILELIVPAGYFLPVTPGIKFITIGGAIASNIHGKNHHSEGAISLYTEALSIMTEDGKVKHCSRAQNQELFKNTIGGMGLTGIILEIALKLKRIETAFIRQKAIKAQNLHQILNLFEAYKDFTYSVAWIDCLAKGKKMGRSILLLGEHAQLTDLDPLRIKNPLQVHTTKQLNVPVTFPNFTLNKFTVKAFNEAYYARQLKNETNSVVHYNPYFYPLDALKNWNRIYGKSGFTQYQFVIPFEQGREGLTKIISKIANSGCGSFLSVLKTFGHPDDISSPISFPMAGYALALDFKITPKALRLLDELDELVLRYGGRLYLTKDARMSVAMFQKTYPGDFTHAPNFASLQSERLGI